MLGLPPVRRHSSVFLCAAQVSRCPNASFVPPKGFERASWIAFIRLGADHCTTVLEEQPGGPCLGPPTLRLEFLPV